MAAEKEKFCSPENYQVLIPYSDLVKISEMAKNYELILAQNKRIEEQYAAMRGMFSECLEKIAEVLDYVKDS